MKKILYIFLLFLMLAGLSKNAYSIDIFPKLPLVLYSEAYSYNKPFQFVPSGWMGDIHALHVNDNWKREPYNGESCMRFEYDTTKPWIHGWTGVSWQYPANNWGNIEGGVNLTNARHLTFWAKGEKGEEILSFKVGGNYGVFSDTTEIIFGPVQLTRQWKQYSIDLTGEDLSYISCGLSWIIDKTQQTIPKIIFYMDDMQFH